MKSRWPWTGPRAMAESGPRRRRLLCFRRSGWLLHRRTHGEPAAIVSCVNYDARFSFLGLYIVRADLRGKGCGLRIWSAAIAHAGPRVIGLDGVTAHRTITESPAFGSLMPCPIRRHGCGARCATGRRRCAVRHSVRRSGGGRRHRVSGAAPGIPATMDRQRRSCRPRASLRDGVKPPAGA